MKDRELLNRIEHILDIFTRIVTKTLTEDLVGGPEEITAAQYQALRHVAQHGPVTVGSLAEGLLISQPAATMLIDRMVKRGLVRREPGRADRRQAEVSLTDLGRDLLNRIESERGSRLESILMLMEEQERRRFTDALESFVASALQLEQRVDEACLRCGIEHRPDCVVNRANLMLSGKDVEKT